MKKILFDTTFLLPLFGIEITISPTFREELRNVWKEGVEGADISISNISLLETLYLLNREFRVKRTTSGLDRYKMVIPTITNAQHIRIIDSIPHPSIISKANEIRFAGHPDYLDCLILGTSALGMDIIVSRDTARLEILEEHALFPKIEMLKWPEFISRFNVVI